MHKYNSFPAHESDFRERRLLHADGEKEPFIPSFLKSTDPLSEEESGYLDFLLDEEAKDLLARNPNGLTEDLYYDYLKKKGLRTVEDISEWWNPQREEKEYQEFRELTPGARELLDHFSSLQVEEITREELERYILGADQTDFIKLYQEYIEQAHSNTIGQNKRNAAEHKLARLLIYLHRRQAVIEQARQSLENISTHQKSTWERAKSEPLELTTDLVLDNLDRCGHTFFRADGWGKVIMLVGTFAGFMLLRAALKKAGGWGLGKNLVLYGGGAWLTWCAFGAMNKTYEKVYGVPIFDLHGNNMLTTDTETYQADLYETKLKQIRADLISKPTNIPEALLNDLDHRGLRFTLAIANFLSLSVEDFLDLYEQGYKSGSLSFENEKYRKICVDDQGQPLHDRLSDTQRFELLRDIADTVGLVNPDGTFVQQNVPVESMLELAMACREPEDQEEEPSPTEPADTDGTPPTTPAAPPTPPL